ncbi:hypothetical protein [Streptomyces fodineus]|nr:hypothetical protein [Streptomyces fodineus]
MPFELASSENTAITYGFSVPIYLFLCPLGVVLISTVMASRGRRA